MYIDLSIETCVSFEKIRCNPEISNKDISFACGKSLFRLLMVEASSYSTNSS